uniref:Uncharacterized protein n=1 Tax=Megaselia scalaris TaxID=36166 RepID=T1GU34_MEGSC
MFDVIKKHPDHPKLNNEVLKLLRALAGNNTTKIHKVQKGAAPIVQNILNRYLVGHNKSGAIRAPILVRRCGYYKH